jgi:hypothetical protein
VSEKVGEKIKVKKGREGRRRKREEDSRAEGEK